MNTSIKKKSFKLEKKHAIYFLLLIVQITVALVTDNVHPIIPLSLFLYVSLSLVPIAFM